MARTSRCLQVRPAADEIDHFILRRIEKHSVDREVARAGVFLRAREMHFGRPAAVEINAIGTKGRDLEMESVFQDDDHAEMRADRIGARKNFCTSSGRASVAMSISLGVCPRTSRAHSHRRSRRRGRDRADALRSRARSIAIRSDFIASPFSRLKQPMSNELNRAKH